MLDRYNRHISYLRISVTDRCNLRCIYCMPSEGIPMKSHSDILSYEEIIRIVRQAVKMGITKYRLTGGEPLIRKDILMLIRKLSAEKGIKELTLTTNGVLLEEMASDLKKSGLDRINVSLDTLDALKYRKLTRIGKLERVLRGIDAVINAGFQGTKLNMVLIPGTNTDEIANLKEFCLRRGLLLQRINHYNLSSIRSINRQYQAERPLDCNVCNRIRLTADGKLKPCLFSNLEIPVDLDDIEGSIKRAILCKPEQGTVCTHRQNWQIGG
jgi:cyclic pyranopterin phosphate synthase